MIRIDQLRHPKEQTYFLLMAICSAVLWLLLLILFFFHFFFLVWLIPVAIAIWIAGYYYKAVIYGSSVEVSENQYQEIYAILKDQSRELGVKPPPHTFIVNSDGVINSLTKNFTSNYIVLFSGMVDLMLNHNRTDELKFIIGHELGHHAAGHLNPVKNLLIAPARIVPFLGAAYGRVCELTADRIGATVARDIKAGKKALVTLALGSTKLITETDIEAFTKQEERIPEILSTIHKIFSPHPRTTLRVIELDKIRQNAEVAQQQPKEKPAPKQEKKSIDLEDL